MDNEWVGRKAGVKGKKGLYKLCLMAFNEHYFFFSSSPGPRNVVVLKPIYCRSYPLDVLTKKLQNHLRIDLCSTISTGIIMVCKLIKSSYVMTDSRFPSAPSSSCQITKKSVHAEDA